MPLAHILAPQIARKAQEIEAELGHAPTGYLEQQNVGYEKTPYDPRGLTDKPGAKQYDPRMPRGAFVQATGTMQKSGDPGQKAFAEGAQRGAMKALIEAGGNEAGAKVQSIPNAPAAPERIPPTAYVRGRALPAKAGDIVATKENGEQIMKTERGKGKNVGYLKAPALSTPYGDQPLSSPVRTSKNINIKPKDAFDATWLEQHFGPHLKAMQDNRDANGMPTDQFPPDYFKGMSKQEVDTIKKGVKALREFQKGTPA